MNNHWLDKQEKIEIEGLLVFYINVGTLSPPRAEAFVKRFEECLVSRNDTWKLPDTVGTIWVPTRAEPTRVDYIAFKNPSKFTDDSLDKLKGCIDNEYEE